MRLTPVDNTYGYEVQRLKAPGQWETIKLSTAGRKIVLTGLTTGTVYTLRVRAIGGSTGFSDWSDPQSHIVT